MSHANAFEAAILANYCKIQLKAYCGEPPYRLGYCREHYERFTTPVGTQEERDAWAAHDRAVLERQKAELEKRYGRRRMAGVLP